MDLYPNVIQDDRVRRNLPAARVMTGKNVQGADCLPGNREIQAFLWGKEKGIHHSGGRMNSG